MSRNFTPDETLIDHLLLDDTSAFEELHHRYCYPLYTYCIGKLDSPADARRMVRDIFIALWENRHSLPVDFSISLYLYTEVRKSVVRCINEKLLDTTEANLIEKQVIPGFSVLQLQKARKPVNAFHQPPSNTAPSVVRKGNYENPWWNNYPATLNLKGIKHALQSMLNFL
jgi:DNA-directed RNA polymerase specialized sigma24 family protein